MKSLIPKHLRDLLFGQPGNGKREEPRKFLPNLIFNQTVEPISLEIITAEVEAELELIQHRQSRRQQLENERDNLNRWKSLTLRQQEIAALVCMGQRNYEIAKTLKIAPGTVKSHLETIFSKFGLRDRHAIRLAFRDWDFQTWWEHRHELPTPLPASPIYK